MRQAKRKKAIASAPTLDSFQNLATRTGLGTANLSSAGSYQFSPTSRNRVELENAYRSSWIVGQVVDAYAEDMTREGIDLLGDGAADWQEEMHRVADRLQLWPAITDTLKWARLYGGCIAVLMLDGQKTDAPLRLQAIRKDQLQGVLVLDRWMVQPLYSELVEEPGPEFGKPKYYNTVADGWGMPNMKIHHTRCIRIDGLDLPYWQRIAENGWGMSVVERLFDRLQAFDSTTLGAAQLVYKAHLRTYKVKGLREIISMGGKAFEGLVKQIDMIRLYQSNEGMTLMDAEDEFEAHQYTFSGLDNVLLQFGQQIAGATGIPLVRLFGQSPAGLNSTGEADLRTYYDNVKQQQEKRLRYPLVKLFNALFRSVTGQEPPENFDFKFNPLWQTSDKEKSEIANNISNAISTASNAGIIDRATALKELRSSSTNTGIFQSVTDEDIKEAEEEPPPVMGEMLGPEGKEKYDKLTTDADFVESEHPRDTDGKFTSKGENKSVNKSESEHPRDTDGKFTSKGENKSVNKSESGKEPKWHNLSSEERLNYYNPEEIKSKGPYQIFSFDWDEWVNVKDPAHEQRIREANPFTHFTDTPGGEEKVWFRFGAPPESNRSTNFAENKGENGVSVYATPKGSGGAAFFGNRKVFTGKGRQVGWGSDGEPLIIPTEEWKPYKEKG